MDEKLINDLMEFGLSSNEAKVYLILNIKGPLTASKISKLTGIPYSKIYEVIDRLKSKTIIEYSLEKRRKKFKAVELTHVFKKVIKKKKKDIDNLEKKVENILEQVKKKMTPDKTQTGIWLSQGKKEFLEKASIMLRKANDYAYGITKEFSRIPTLDNEIINARKRGVKVKIIGTKKFNELNLSRAKWYASRDVKIKAIPLGIQPRICLIDDKEVCIRVDNDYNSEFIWSNNPALINLVKSYFEVLWKNAKLFKNIV